MLTNILVRICRPQVAPLEKVFSSDRDARKWLRQHGLTVRDASKSPDHAHLREIWTITSKPQPVIPPDPQPVILPLPTPDSKGKFSLNLSSRGLATRSRLAAIATDTVRQISEDLGLEIEVIVRARGRRCSCRSFLADKTHPHFQIIFRLENLEGHAAAGYQEYPSLQHLLTTRGLDRPRDAQCAKIIAIHEAAHAVANLTFSNANHGPVFAQNYAALLDLYAR